MYYNSINASGLIVVVKIRRLSDRIKIQLYAIYKRHPQETLPKHEDTERVKVNVR